MNRTQVWDYRFLGMAHLVSGWSKDPSTKVGAVIAKTKSHRVVGVGYNGLPPHIGDTEDRLSDRSIKLSLTIHAEENAIFFSKRRNFSKCTLYVVPFMPCATCASKIIQAGFKRVVSIASDSDAAKRWVESFYLTKEVFAEAGIELVLYGVDGGA